MSKKKKTKSKQKPALREKHRPQFAFERKNFVVMFIGLGVIILGYLLMSGGGSDSQVFDPDVFSWRRIRLAPTLVLLGFCIEVYAILLKPKKTEKKEES